MSEQATELYASDCEMCFARPGADHIIDVVDPRTGRTWINGKTLEECPGAVLMKLEDFCKAKAARQDTPVTWDEITEEQYDYWFECLPPAAYSQGAFLVGEPSDHHAGSGRPRYQACRSYNGKHYASSRPVTKAEFREVIQTPIA